MNTVNIYAVNGINIFGRNTATAIVAVSAEAAIIAAKKHQKVIAPMVEKMPEYVNGKYQSKIDRYEKAEAVAERTLALIERGQYLAAKDAEKSYTYKD